MIITLRSTLTLSHFGLLVLLALLLTCGWYLQVRSFQRSQIRMEVEADTTLISHAIEEALSDRIRSLTMLSQARPVKDYSRTWRELPLIAAMSTYSTTFTSLSYLGADGNEEVCVVKGRTREGENSYAGLAWFNETLEEAGQVLVGLVPPSHGSQPMVRLSLALHDYFANQTVGILLAYFPLNDLLHAQEGYVKETGRSIVLFGADRSTLLILHSEGYMLAPGSPFPFASSQAKNSRPLHGTPMTLFGTDGFAAGVESQAAGLQVTLFAPLAPFSALLNRLMRHSLMVLIPLLFLLGIASAYLARRLTLPLNQLTEASEEIAAGNLDARVDSAGSCEIGKLASSFNRMAAALRDSTVSRDHLVRIFSVMKEAVMVVDAEGRIELCNPSARVLFPFLGEPLEGKPLGDLLPSIDRAGELPCRIAESGQHLELKVADATVLLSSTLFEGASHVLVAQDITRQIEDREHLRQMAENLEASNRELEQFAYVASHDLQEPLRKITAFGDRLQTRCGNQLDDTGRDYLARMENAASRMQRLINDLLTFSRVTTRGRKFERVDLGTVVREVLEDLEVRVKDLDADIRLENLPAIVADPTQMRQLFQNLIGNALKFHAPDRTPSVVVRSSRHIHEDQDFWRIEVSDNGIGFDEKYLERIFGVFQRLHGRESYEGSGIGLSVCQKIVQRHGGEITATSAEGSGSTFIITLPSKQEISNHDKAA